MIADNSRRPGSPTLDQGICDFLMKATHWHGPNAHGMDQIQKMLRSRVK